MTATNIHEMLIAGLMHSCMHGLGWYTLQGKRPACMAYNIACRVHEVHRFVQNKQKKGLRLEAVLDHTVVFGGHGQARNSRSQMGL